MDLSRRPLEVRAHDPEKTNILRKSAAEASVDAEPYVPEKATLTDRDFEDMECHDVQVHAIAVANEFPKLTELLLDLDYILKWVDSNRANEYFRFWIAPATLVFEHVFNLSLRIQSEQLDCQIDQITRELRKTPRDMHTWFWTVKLHQGEITFWSTGYKQYFRQRPVLHNSQHFNREERGGLSFTRGRLLSSIHGDRRIPRSRLEWV